MTSIVRRKFSVTVLSLALALPFDGQAKGYSSGSHSYSSHSSHSSGGGGSHSSSTSHSSSSPSRSSSGGGTSRSSSPSSSKSFSSGGGKSYSSRSTASDNDRRGYSSGKSYTSGSGKTFATKSAPAPAPAKTESTKRTEPASAPSSFSYDTAAARARKEQTSKQEFTKFKETQIPNPSAPSDSSRPISDSTYRGQTPSIPTSSGRTYRRTVYVPDQYTLSTRPIRIETVFRPYYSRPVVIYNDPYNSFFWWWLLDRSLDDRAWWAYHHRYDMDPARYDALVATDQQLQARLAQLEAQQVQRDPAYVPTGVDRDLMYSDQYLAHAYSNRRTGGGVLSFWLIAVPTAIGVCWFFIWLIWFKRWKTST